jgi:molybdopterin converting factor small subunit
MTMSKDSKKRFVPIVAFMFFVIYFIGIANVFAQSGTEPDFKPVADEMIGASGITWIPKINYAQLKLTVSRPDNSVFQRTFTSGSNLYLGLNDILGNSNGDGSYTYELRVIPVINRSNRDDEASVSRDKKISPRALTQSGHFLVKDGAIINRNWIESGSGYISTAQEGLSRAQDIVYNDDLIVMMSLCVGTDCNNGESFGFDTIRLKENNLRIRFYDTSNSASFPTNDWQITANDSTNGGANKFSIDDIDNGRTPFTIEAGAPSNSLFVEDSGQVGFGTSTPVTDLHVVSGNTPTLRLEQDGSSGFTPQTWDVAGNEASFFIRDATNGGHLSFRIQPGAPDSSIYIKSDGKIGMGTNSPSYPLHVVTNSSTNAAIVGVRNGGASIFMSATNTFGQFGTITNHPSRILVNAKAVLKLNGSNPFLEVIKDSAGTVGATCDGDSWLDSSTREAKENIIDLTEGEALQALNDLNPVKYNYKTNKEEERLGFIAEDVPELVAMNSRKNLSAMDIVAVLTRVLKEQQKTISELKEKVKKLEKK